MTYPPFQLPLIDLTVFLGILTAIGLLLQIRKGDTVIAPPLRMTMPFLVICVISAISLTYTMVPAYGLDKLLKFSNGYSHRMTFWVCALLAAGGAYLAFDSGEFARMPKDPRDTMGKRTRIRSRNVSHKARYFYIPLSYIIPCMLSYLNA